MNIITFKNSKNQKMQICKAPARGKNQAKRNFELITLDHSWQIRSSESAGPSFRRKPESRNALKNILDFCFRRNDGLLFRKSVFLEQDWPLNMVSQRGIWLKKLLSWI